MKWRDIDINRWQENANNRPVWRGLIKLHAKTLKQPKSHQLSGHDDECVTDSFSAGLSD